MHVTVRVVLSLLSILAAPGIGFARCDPSVEPDRTDVATARAAVAASCDCAMAASHRDYVRCARQAADAVLVNKRCGHTVRRCASRSTCGRPGYVTCCRTRSSGKLSCAVKRTAARCVAPRGGSACVGSLPSCCDACVGGGCATTTTTTTTSSTTTSNPFSNSCGPDGFGSCGGLCGSLDDECVQDAQTGECICVPAPCRPLGGIGSCHGTCPGGGICTLCASCGGCGCFIPCSGGSGAPTCDGTCPPSYVCGYDSIDNICGCHQ